MATIEKVLTVCRWSVGGFAVAKIWDAAPVADVGPHKLIAATSKAGNSFLMSSPRLLWLMPSPDSIPAVANKPITKRRKLDLSCIRYGALERKYLLAYICGTLIKEERLRDFPYASDTPGKDPGS